MRSYPFRAMRTLFFGLALLGAGSVFSVGAEKPTIVLVSGEFEYLSNLTLPALGEYLEKHLPVETIYLERTAGESIPGIEAIEKADLLIVAIRRMTLPDDQLAHFQKHLRSGKPLIGVRTTSHAFENWKTFDAEVLGGNYHGHHPNGLFPTIHAVPEAKDHPILRGVLQTFRSSGSLYKNDPLPASSELLLVGELENEKPEPVAWTHGYQGARVFYTSLGYPDEYYDQHFLQMLVNAAYWGLNQKPPADSLMTEVLPQIEPKTLTIGQFEAQAKHHRFTVLDVRTPKEYAAGHVRRALNYDASAPDFETRVLAEIPLNEAVVVYCQTGRRAAAATEKLERLGYKFLYQFPGGFAEWQQAGKPVEK